MESPKQPTTEETLEFCRQILRVASQLGKGETCCVWFHTAARKNQVIEVLNTRYSAADTDRIEINLYH